MGEIENSEAKMKAKKSAKSNKAGGSGSRKAKALKEAA